MGIQNLLTEVALYGQTYEVSLNWIGQLIRGLITGVGSVGVGIILFSLILKFIVMPFDIFQRISMRKQNLKMRENKEKMEKLQKQYANNKEMYNKKVQEMYKANGMSVFSSCLPMILSMVIFFVAIGAFNDYSTYSTVNNYNQLVKAYDNAIVDCCDDLVSYQNIDGKITIDTDEAIAYYSLEENYGDKKLTEEYLQGQIDAGKAENRADAVARWIEERAQEAVVVEYETNVKSKTSFLWIKNIWQTDATYKSPVADYEDFSMSIYPSSGCGGCSSSGVDFENEKGEDVSINDLENGWIYKAEEYNHVTAKLGAQKDQSNGYYILIVLSIGTILLQQILSSKANKEQQKYSTVDGQGGSQTKMMMIIMTLMFAIFSFLYSAAFAIYMVMSNVMSLISMLFIHKAVDIAMEKKEERAFRAKHDVRYIDKKDKKNKK
jgi:membrane protein insertase Oxa1/YidC/SpoIIIJ